MVGARQRAHAAAMANIEVQPKQTPAFFLQAAISFAVSLSAVVIGVAYLPVDGWVRSFLGIGVLYIVTSSFTLAKCVRDQQESNRVIHRVDEARLERFLAEHDPFKTTV